MLIQIAYLTSDAAKQDPSLYAQNASEYINFIRDIAKQLDPLMVQLFEKLPRCPYGVVEIPAHEAPSSPGAYYMPPDSTCSRAGYFYANTYYLPTSKFDIVSTTLHETVLFRIFEIFRILRTRKIRFLRRYPVIISNLRFKMNSIFRILEDLEEVMRL